MSSIVRFVSMQLGEQLAATLNCLEFTFSEGGDRNWQGATDFGGGPIFSLQATT